MLCFFKNNSIYLLNSSVRSIFWLRATAWRGLSIPGGSVPTQNIRGRPRQVLLMTFKLGERYPLYTLFASIIKKKRPRWPYPPPPSSLVAIRIKNFLKYPKTEFDNFFPPHNFWTKRAIFSPNIATIYDFANWQHNFTGFFYMPSKGLNKIHIIIDWER